MWTPGTGSSGNGWRRLAPRAHRRRLQALLERGELVAQSLRQVRAELRNRVAVEREGKTQLESLIDRSREFAPAGAELPPDARLPASLIFRDASSRDIYTAIARCAG